MLMGHPPPIIARGREDAPQGCFEGLTPVQVPMVVEELVAGHSQGQETLADPLEVVQEITQAGPNTFHRITVHTRAVGGTPSILARAMVDRPMVIVGRSEMGDGVFIGEELRPAFHLGGHDGFDRRGAHMLQHFEIDLCGWCVLVGLVTALHQAQQGWTTRLGGGATAKLNPALSRCAFVAFDFTDQSFAARTLVALIRFSLVLQLACRLQMVRLVDAPIQQINRGLVITPEPRQSFPWRGYRRNIEVLPTISYGGALCYCRSPCLSPWSSWWTVSPCPDRPPGDVGVPRCIPIGSF